MKTNPETGLMDVELGLQYSAGQEELYCEFLEAFLDMAKGKRGQIDRAYEDGNWEDYTTFVHALKSTSLTVGGKTLSEAAKALEMAGKAYAAPNATEEEKEEQLRFIREHHGETMALYDAFVAEAKAWLAEHAA